ncbi:MAG: ORF6N domain-containing protein [Chitinophagales bacterium]
MSKAEVISQKQIENRIFVFRNLQVMIDRDLAELYQVETKVLNQAVKRNADRFPESFRFKLNKNEKEELVTICDRFETLKHSTTNPYVFTEQGVAMLSAILRSKTAIQVSIKVINAFVEMRRVIASNIGLWNRLDNLEQKQLKSQLQTDQKFEQVFKALEKKDDIPTQGVFFDGQVFDAYELASKIIRSAKENIVLIDNYINESTITHLAKKKKGVKVLLLCKTPSTGSGQASKQLTLDIKKANEQYSHFEAKTFNKSHDRFLIIDGKEVYHLGASLKDLGKKWFAFSKMEKASVQSIINSISELI